MIGPSPKKGFWSKNEKIPTLHDLSDNRVFLAIEYDESEEKNFLEKAYYITRESNFLLKKKVKYIRKLARTIIKL